MVNFLNRIRIHFSCLCLCLKDIALNQWKCVYVLFISLFISFGFIYICWFTSNFIINLPILSHERRFDYKIYRLWRTMHCQDSLQWANLSWCFPCIWTVQIYCLFNGGAWWLHQISKVQSLTHFTLLSTKSWDSISSVTV